MTPNARAMNQNEDTRFMPLVGILLLSGALAFVLGGFAFRLAAFGVVLLGLIAGHRLLSSTDDEPESEARNDTGRTGRDRFARGPIGRTEPDRFARGPSRDPEHTRRPSAQRPRASRKSAQEEP